MSRDTLLFLLLGAVSVLPVLVIWLAISAHRLSPLLGAALTVVVFILAGAGFEFYLNLSYALLTASIIGLSFGAATIVFGLKNDTWRA